MSHLHHLPSLSPLALHFEGWHWFCALKYKPWTRGAFLITCQVIPVEETFFLLPASECGAWMTSAVDFQTLVVLASFPSVSGVHEHHQWLRPLTQATSPNNQTSTLLITQFFNARSMTLLHLTFSRKLDSWNLATQLTLFVPQTWMFLLHYPPVHSGRTSRCSVGTPVRSLNDIFPRLNYSSFKPGIRILKPLIHITHIS